MDMSPPLPALCSPDVSYLSWMSELTKHPAALDFLAGFTFLLVLMFSSVLVSKMIPLYDTLGSEVMSSHACSIKKQHHFFVFVIIFPRLITLGFSWI